MCSAAEPAGIESRMPGAGMILAVYTRANVLANPLRLCAVQQPNGKSPGHTFPSGGNARAWLPLNLQLPDIVSSRLFGLRRGSMAGSSRHVNRTSEHREILFWLLLLGSWQFLTAQGGRNATVGAVGTAAFLLFAGCNLGKLRGLGLANAGWRPTTAAVWLVATSSGFVAGAAVYAIGSASGQNMMLSSDWRLVVLQLTLGPVLEEVVFRGYLFALLACSFGRFATDLVLNWLVVITAALVFAVVHLAQPGVSWLQLACITSTGTLYGWIRQRSGSTAPAAMAHAAYNLMLYAAAGVTALHFTST
jgi:membrane protease YdiL (CAAX protease family)